MKLFHFFLLILSLSIGVFLGQLDFVQTPIVEALMPGIKSETIALEGNLNDFFADETLLQKSVNSWFNSLSPQAKVGQLIMPAWTEADDLSALIKDGTIGGFMWLGGKIRPITSPNKVPLLIASDAEPSLLKYRFENPPFVGETADLKNPDDIQTVGRNIAVFLKYLGINLNFAPVYDQNVNQSVIGSRSFGTNPANQANQLARVFKRQNIIPTAKHFPGHGLVTEDTHLENATITRKLAELPQFIAAIKQKIPVMMVGHLAVNTPEHDTQGQPATVSSVIMRDLLRDQLGFRGVIITDAMNMKAVSNVADRDLKSLLAGSDIVLMPENPKKLNAQLVEILDTNPKVLEEKIKRVLRLKLVWKLSEAQ